MTCKEGGFRHTIVVYLDFIKKLPLWYVYEQPKGNAVIRTALVLCLALSFRAWPQQKPPPPQQNQSCCPPGGQPLPASCTLLANSSLLSRVDRLTCAQYATARLSPDQSLMIKNSAHTRNDIAFGAKLAAQRGQISTTLKGHAHVYHPSGGAVFPGQSDLAASLDNVISALRNSGAVTQQGKSLSHFVPLFRKFQFMALNDLYNYLTSVYMMFNLIHKNSVQSYLADESAQAFNKKSLMVTHLLNVIQQQMFFICAHHQPLMPRHFALKAGSLMLQHDDTADPLFLIKDLEAPFFPGDLSTPAQKIAHEQLKKIQTTYLSTLATILNFYRAYTGSLNQSAPLPAVPGSNAFATMASHIQKLMDNEPFNLSVRAIARRPGTTAQESKAKIQALREARASLTSINPPLLYYNEDTIRACTVIPAIARQLPATSQAVGWPEHLVKSAQAGTQATALNGTTALGFSIAYFEDAQQRVTRNLAQAEKLFINLPTIHGPYAQEIQKQPAWLDSYQGVIGMLGACLGDLGHLVGMNILNPCTERIICAALETGCAGLAQASCQAELQSIRATQQEYMEALNASTSATQAQTKPVPPVTPPVQSGYQAIGGYLPPPPGS